MDLRRHSRTLRPSLCLVVIAIAAMLALLLAGCEGEEVGRQTVTPTPSEDASPTPEVTPTPTPPPTVDPKFEKKPERYAMAKAGPVAAEPVRVHTGDGDCLNVRPTPGTQFQSDPRTCVPEGFLLWLYGDGIDLDGYHWRYALGEGWVADEFVKPDPSAASVLADRVSPVIVSTTDGAETYFSRVDPGGQVTLVRSIDLAGTGGLGLALPEVMPGGEWVGWTTWASWPTAHFMRFRDGSVDEHPGYAFLGWSDSGKALLAAFPNCPNSCSGEKLAYVEPGSAPVEFATIPSGAWGYTWRPGTDSVIMRAEANSLYEYSLTGEKRVLISPNTLPLDLGEIAVSPSGDMVLSSPFLGPLQLVSLQTGDAQRFERAPQVSDLPGRCGGSSGKLAVWLDEQTFAWHESYALKGQNGITIGSLRTGERTLVPFFTIQDVRRVEGDLLSFTTWEYIELNGRQDSFPLTWLLDPDTGEARPVTVGSAPAWQVDGASTQPLPAWGGI